MMLFMRWFLFTLCLALEIKVRATGELRERPEGCLKQEQVCALQTDKSVFHFSNTNSEFHLGQKSLILRHSSTELEFISGTLWVERYPEMKVSTLFGDIKGIRGPYWIMGDHEKIWIRNINADLKVVLRDGRQLEVPVGFQVWLSGRDENGKMTLGIPEAIPVAEHLRLWSQMFPGTKQEFAEAVQNVKWTWGSLPDRAAELYTQIVHRQQTIAQDRQNRLQRRQMAQEAEARRSKELFIEKAFYR